MSRSDPRTSHHSSPAERQQSIANACKRRINPPVLRLSTHSASTGPSKTTQSWQLLAGQPPPAAPPSSAEAAARTMLEASPSCHSLVAGL